MTVMVTNKGRVVVFTSGALQSGLAEGLLLYTLQTIVNYQWKTITDYIMILAYIISESGSLLGVAPPPL